VGSSTFRKRDLGRYVKVYPFVRRTPQWGYISDNTDIMESARLVMNSQSQITYTFMEDGYLSTPSVTITAVQTPDGSNGADVNAYVTAISRYNVTIETSQEFTGELHLQVMYIKAP